ncbi:hypothetical protein HOE425_330801 [Hoeflea sp. EC-HK425]|nr:hypothetical protein HOE425_330801 [Hoeflea sp. EC-HK425]
MTVTASSDILLPAAGRHTRRAFSHLLKCRITYDVSCDVAFDYCSVIETSDSKETLCW